MVKIMNIKLIVLDIDGVLTDGKVVIDGDNNEFKTLNYHDMDGITLLKQKGINIALLTGEDTVLVDIIANRLGIKNVIKGCKDKEKGLIQLSKDVKMSLNNTCYIGDSDRDAPAFKICGLSFVPQNATKKAKEFASVILDTKGGDGVVNEIIEYLKENSYFKWDN